MPQGIVRPFFDAGRFQRLGKLAAIGDERRAHGAVLLTMRGEPRGRFSEM